MSDLAPSLAVWDLPCLLGLKEMIQRTCIHEDCRGCGCCKCLRLTKAAHNLTMLHAPHHVLQALWHVADP